MLQVMQDIFFSPYTILCPYQTVQFCDIRSSTSADTFRRLLKTHCFQQAYRSPYRLSQVPQIRPLADIVHFKYAHTYLLTYLQYKIVTRL